MLKVKNYGSGLALALALILGLNSGIVKADRVKDVANIAGVRSNPLYGYGLVVGLDGSGDKSTGMAEEVLRNMITRLGIYLQPGLRLKADNVAVVAVHATLPAFSKPGKLIDITVSSFGKAKSLRGGTLLMTPLKGADDQIYAIAQGSVVASGFGAEGADGSKVTVGVPTVGRIPNGAMVEREVVTPFGEEFDLVLNLKQPDFTTAHRLVQAINKAIGPGTAYPLDAGSVKVNAPTDPAQRVSYVSLIENLTMTPAEGAAKIVVNSRTGTVVIGKHVHVLPAAVSHGSLTVTITESQQVSQPGPLARRGQTAIVPESNVEISKPETHMFLLDPGTTLDEIVRAINEVGAAPGDLVAILEALKEAGALRAELVVI